MSKFEWSKEQRQVIEARGRDLLVSAAAGSGKTAVLSERIVREVVDDGIDIDRILVVTFTRAAAMEMKERIRSALAERALRDPGNAHLERQMTLVHTAQITTIDSFCTYVVRNHFNDIGLDPAFRIAETGEVRLIRQDTLDALFRRHYEDEDPDFLRLADAYATKDTDDALLKMTDKLLNTALGYPNPRGWLEGIRGVYHPVSAADIEGQAWICEFVEHTHLLMDGWIEMLRHILTICGQEGGPVMYREAIESDIAGMQHIKAQTRFDDIVQAMNDYSWKKLGRARKGMTIDPLLKDTAQSMRNAVKKSFDNYRAGLGQSLASVYEELLSVKPYADTLISLTEEYLEAFGEAKRQRGVLDFNDLEHMALQILCNADGSQREAAVELMEHYAEIMIDEYQDSNYLQETILRAISGEHCGRHDLFMVGDVKQSIYAFRQARPDLFMDKLDTYCMADAGEENLTQQKVFLSRNFRSRKEVIDITNDIFSRIMRADLGGVEYSPEAALYKGADYPVEDAPSGGYMPEVMLLSQQAEERAAYQFADADEAEAVMVCARIHELMQTLMVMDRSSGQLRPVRYSDIAILLRSPGRRGDSWVQTLLRGGIPAHMTSQEGYFDTVEVSRVLAMLSVVNNPQNDKDLITVLLSGMGGFSNDDLFFIRSAFMERTFYQSFSDMVEYARNPGKVLRMPSQKALEVMPPDLCGRTLHFAQRLEAYRVKASCMPVHELIMYILNDTGYLDTVSAYPDGDIRRANLIRLVDQAVAFEKTSYRGLYRFIRYIEELRKYEVDFGAAELIGEEDDAVRIMSIHKSKGLEFPVVFLCGLGTGLNLKDTTGNMVIDASGGIGLDAIDIDRRTRRATFYKNVLGQRVLREDLGEEMRVLYVAMTRAREKLILTASFKDADATIQSARMTAQMAGSNAPLSYAARSGARNFMDWILPALFACDGRYDDIIHVYGLETLVDDIADQTRMEQGRREALEAMGRGADPDRVRELRGRLEYVYPYENEREYKTKYSVSEIKYRAMDLAYQDDLARPAFRKPPVNPHIPAFIRRPNEADGAGHWAGSRGSVPQGALRGTAMHRVMECYDFAREDFRVSLMEQLEDMTASGRLTGEQRALIVLPQLQKLIDSPLAMRIHAAAGREEYQAEEPFVMGLRPKEFSALLSAVSEGNAYQVNALDASVHTEAPSEIAAGGFIKGDAAGHIETPDKAETTQEPDGPADDLILVQGIIDGFFKEDEGYILFDYKTDRVDAPDELIRRYATQMQLYAMAIERTWALPVREKILYSFSLGREIVLE